MAEIVMLKHSPSGLLKKGFVGFSWTTLFFGGVPALFRGDFKTFLLYYLIVLCGAFFLGVAIVSNNSNIDQSALTGIGNTFGFICSLVWAFFYNKYYTQKLLESGYELNDTSDKMALARLELGISS